MKQQMNRWIAVGTLSVMSFTGMGLVSGTAQAKKSTAWKYGAIAGAGLAGYGLLKHNGRAATVGGLVAAGSYYEYRHNKKKEDKKKAEQYRRRSRQRSRHHRKAGSKKHHNKTAEQRREDWYRQRYGNDWKSHYKR